MDLSRLHVMDAQPKQALWAFEQTLRSGACAAVLGWPNKVDHHGLRRLLVAAHAGHALDFVQRDRKHAEEASPAALRLELDRYRQVRVRKCRGGPAPTCAFAIASLH